MIGPANVLDDGGEGDYVIEVAGQERALPLDGLKSVGAVAVADLSMSEENEIAVWPVDRMRTADAIEEVIVTCGNDEMTMALSALRLTASDEGWIVDGNVPFDDVWHGASVVAARDGFVIGTLIRDGDRSQIIPLAEELLAAARETSSSGDQ